MLEPRKMRTQLFADLHINIDLKIYFMSQLLLYQKYHPLLPTHPAYITANWKLNSLLVKA